MRTRGCRGRTRREVLRQSRVGRSAEAASARKGGASQANPLAHADPPRPATELAALIREQPDRTLADDRRPCARRRVSPRCAARSNGSASGLKKTVHASEHDRADVRRARTAWRAAAPTLDPARLVFLDESGVRTDLIRRYGRGLSGARVPDHTPDGRWHTTTPPCLMARSTAPVFWPTSSRS